VHDVGVIIINSGLLYTFHNVDECDSVAHLSQ